MHSRQGSLDESSDQTLVLAVFTRLDRDLTHMLYILCRGMRFPTTWYVRPAMAQTSLRIRAVWSEPLLVAWIFYDF